MSEHAPLFIDADLELVCQGEFQINLRLEAGQGVIELSNALMLRKLIKDSLIHRERRTNLQRVFGLSKFIPSRIDIRVAGKPIAHLDTEVTGGMAGRLMGMPGLHIRPVALIIALFK
jgi:hypothetical protein